MGTPQRLHTNVSFRRLSAARQRPCCHLIPAPASKPGKWRDSLSPHQHCDKCATTCSQHLLLRGSVLASEYEVRGHKSVQKKCFIAVRFPTRTDGRVRSPDICRSKYHTVFWSHSLLWIDIYVKFMAPSKKIICEGQWIFCNLRAAHVMFMHCFLPRNGDRNSPMTMLVSQRVRSPRDRSWLLLSGSWSYGLITTPHMLIHTLPVCTWPYFIPPFHHCHHHLHH